MRVKRPGPGTLVTVVGLAKSGMAAAQWLLELGSLVRVTEANQTRHLEEMAETLRASGAVVELGRHTKQFVAGAELVVTSPGVPMTASPLVWAREQGIPCVGELELASWYCAGPTIAVTGSNGKSTVVTLLGELLRASGKEAIVCGNIGQPFCSVLSTIRPSAVAVLEVSSFQLESSLAFHTNVASVLNLSDNHLDRHGSFAEYKAAKARLLTYQNTESWSVLNADNPESASYASLAQGTVAYFSRTRKVNGACIRDNWLHLNLPTAAGPICRRDELFRTGIHHEENALAAACMAGIFGAPPEKMAAVFHSFRGLPHRQEQVATVRGIPFINDSKSTTVASGIRAIEAVPHQLVLIAGGRDKGSNFLELRKLAHKLKGVVVIGEDGPKIAGALKGIAPTFYVESLEKAVRMAFDMAAEGDQVVLSPMCTSFDMFHDFEERGERFSEAVHQLALSSGGQ